MTPDAYARLSLETKVFTVTGGGSGIGRAAARLLAARGAAVVVADLDESTAAATAATIRAAQGRAVHVQTDVSHEPDVERMIALAVSEYGRFDGGFNNAGRNGSGQLLAELDPAQWQGVMAVNLTGVFYCMKHQIARLLSSDSPGAIVNTASAAGVLGFPNVPEYVASKHGVVGLTRAAAVDYSAAKVRVNAVLPGGTMTPMLAEAMLDPVRRRAAEASHPIGRMGEPGEIAEAVAWLLSDAASFVTGAALAVDGGMTCV